MRFLSTALVVCSSMIGVVLSCYPGAPQFQPVPFYIPGQDQVYTTVNQPGGAGYSGVFSSSGGGGGSFSSSGSGFGSGFSSGGGGFSSGSDGFNGGFSSTYVDKDGKVVTKQGALRPEDASKFFGALLGR